MYETLMIEAKHYYDIKQYSKALDIINKALAERPDDGYAFFLKAACLNDSGRYEEALHACGMCMQFGYELKNTHNLLAVIYKNLEDFSKSEYHLLETLRLDPQNAAAIATYSFIMYQTGHTEKSDALMAKAARIDPLHEKVLLYRQMIEEARGGQKAKQKALLKYVENTVNEFDRLIVIGNHHIEKKQYKKAHECFRQAFLMEPGSQELAEVLSDIEKKLSPAFIPMRLFWVMSPFMVWGIFIALVYLLSKMGMQNQAGVLSIIYVIFVIYSWTIEPLYRLFHRKK